MNLEKCIEAAYNVNIHNLELDIAVLRNHIGKFKNDDCMDLKLAIAERYGRIMAYQGILNTEYHKDLHFDFDVIGKIREAEQEVN